MGEVSPLDDRGRFTVDPRFRKFLGKRIVQIWTPHGLLLRPISGRLKPGDLPPSLSIDGDALYHAEEAKARKADRE